MECKNHDPHSAEKLDGMDFYLFIFWPWQDTDAFFQASGRWRGKAGEFSEGVWILLCFTTHSSLEKHKVYYWAGFGLELILEVSGALWGSCAMLITPDELAVKATMCSQYPLSQCCNFGGSLHNAHVYMQTFWLIWINSPRLKIPGELFTCIPNRIVNFEEQINLYACSV